MQSSRAHFLYPFRVAALLALFCVLTVAALAAEDKVTASVSQQLVTVGSRVTYTLSVVSSSSRPNVNELQVLTLPTFENMTQLSDKPSLSNKYQSINGVGTGTLTATWSLTTDKVGTAKISAGEFQYKGKKYSTPAFEIKVVKDETDTLPPELKSQDIISASTDSPEINKQLKGRLFARLIVSNDKPTIQEPIVVRCVLYADNLAEQIRGVAWDAPAWTDFFAEAQPQGEQLTVREENIGGRKYQAITLGEVVLTPTRAGKIEIPAHAVRCGLRIQNNARPSFEDDFFGGGIGSMLDNRMEARMPLAVRVIDVQPLPEQGRPASFQNAVGQFAFAAHVDRQQMSEDDLLTLVLEVDGQGYLGSIGQPKLPKLDGWKDVGTQSKTESVGKVKSQGGKKIFEILLRPEKTGTLTIPLITYATYDPEQKKYVEQTAGPFQVQVAKGKERPLLVAGNTASPTPAVSASAASAPQFFGEQLAYIHPDLPAFVPATPPLYHRVWYAPLCLLSLLLVGLAAAGRFWQVYTAAHAGDLKARSAGGKARKELREAGAALRAKKLDEFYLKLGEAVRGYLGVKLNRSASGLTLDEIARTLGERGVDAETARGTRDLLETCDQARYMPGAKTEENARELLNRAEALLKDLDKKIVAGGKVR